MRIGGRTTPRQDTTRRGSGIGGKGAAAEGAAATLSSARNGRRVESGIPRSLAQSARQLPDTSGSGEGRAGVSPDLERACD